MAVVKTASPNVSPTLPYASPRKVRPSSRTRRASRRRGAHRYGYAQVAEGIGQPVLHGRVLRAQADRVDGGNPPFEAVFLDLTDEQFRVVLVRVVLLVDMDVEWDIEILGNTHDDIE